MKFGLNLSTCLTLEDTEKNLNLWHDLSVYGTGKHKYVIMKAKKKYKSYFTCYIRHLLSPGIRYVRLRHKAKL